MPEVFQAARAVATAIRPLVGKRVMVHRKINGQQFEVILMAVSGNWAMVRHPRCLPFVCEVDEIVANNAVRGAAEPRTLDGLVGSSEVPK